jgi:hypothetical protein
MLWSTFCPVQVLGPDVSLDAPEPQVLTRCRFCLCIANQRSFIESLIRVLSEANRSLKVGFKLALPAKPFIWTATLQDLLLQENIIRKIGLPQREDDWVHLNRWDRRTLPHGRFECLEARDWF